MIICRLFVVILSSLSYNKTIIDKIETTMFFFNKTGRHTHHLFKLIHNYQDSEAIAFLDKYKKTIDCNIVNNQGRFLFNAVLERDYYSNECLPELALKIFRLNPHKMNFSDSLTYAVRLMDAEKLISAIVEFNEQQSFFTKEKGTQKVSEALFNYCADIRYIPLMTKNIDIASLYSNKQNLLTHWATWFYNNPERLLFNIHKKEKNGTSQHSVDFPFAQLLNFYIDNGIDVNQPDQKGQTAMSIILPGYLRLKNHNRMLLPTAYEHRTASLNMIKLLLHKGSNLIFNDEDHNKFKKNDIDELQLIRVEIERLHLNYKMTVSHSRPINRI